jgi:polysaccharide biosynthesis protein PelA
VDLRNPLWAKRVIEEVIPSLLAQGFDGIFLDTLDSPIEAERAEPKRYAGMRAATVNAVKAIRANYPHITIMVNRAYPALGELSPYIDKVLGESVYRDYDFSKKTYGKVEEALYQQQVKWLQEAKAGNSAIRVYTLDYADKGDAKAIAEIYRVQRANGFIPYVATVELNEIVPEPKS